ncbi:MAG TPA: right-handed parallel beta-helix repeat-containing protein [Verrucomicrobiae bacterium]|nr:right-handed parallel beta-helix repeat-containing protein [Verrucomicrobiae bacterium]
MKLLILILLAAAVPVSAVDIHVSPSGKPTLQEAIHAARKRPAGEPCAIWLGGGTYELTEPLVLENQDSGIVIAAEKGAKPILSGGKRVSGWKEVNGLWEAKVENWHFRSLFVNGHRATIARTPNAGAFFHMQGERLSDKPAQFKFARGEIKPEWAQEPDATVVAFEKWTDFRRYIRAVSTNDNLVRLSGDAASHTHEGGARYFIENTADSLDAPGEWRLDRGTSTVRYRPRPGETLATAETIAPRLDEMFVIKGASNVVVRGLTFTHTDWVMAEDGYTDRQAAVHVPGDLRGEGAVNCAIEQCELSHLGGYAIEFSRGCQRNRIVGNTIFDIGAGGIRLGEPGDKQPDAVSANHSHTITDNEMRELGRVNAPAIGVLILQSGTNRVAHNHIHDLYYTAISVGWNWGYQETPCRENIIEFNHLHNIGQGMLSDMGAVYTLGIQRGTVVRNNLIHDVTSFTYGGWGLYPDEGSTGIVFENNVVYRTKSAGFHQHYGRDNIVRNNIFAFGKEYQVMRSREESHISFIFTNNIVYFDSGDLLGSYWKNDRYVMENNIYFDTRSKTNMTFAGATLDQWRARGHDTNSIIADPLFIAPQKADFRLKKDSPALKRGFKPLDPTDAGPRKSLAF